MQLDKKTTLSPGC